MKKVVYIFLLVLWVPAGTILVSRWWYANPDYFPHFSGSFWYYLDRVFGASNIDDAQNVEFFVVVAASLLIVVAITMGIVTIAGYAKRKLTNNSCNPSKS